MQGPEQPSFLANRNNDNKTDFTCKHKKQTLRALDIAESWSKGKGMWYEIRYLR